MTGVTAVAVSPLQAAARSDTGRVRTNNEDLPILDAARGLFGVIDGVGGHSAGEVAAAIARDVMLQRLGRTLGSPAERVREAIAIANNEIFRRARETPALAGMTCVVTLAVVAEGRLTIGHVGDSRLYKFGPRGIRKLTHDHSPVGEREDAREIDEVSAMHHPRRHEVFRDVGSTLRDKDEADFVEVIDDVLADDEAILLCSDGLTDMLTSTVVAQIVRSHAGAPEAVVDALVAAANEAGGRDNVTVVYAEARHFAQAVHEVLAQSPAVAVAPPGGVPFRRAAWFTSGVAVGVVCALLIAWRALEAPAVGGRTLAAAPVASEPFVTLAEAVTRAGPGDVIRLEPGEYAEQLVLPAGVSLEARVPGTSTFVRPPGGAADWIAITATGDQGGRVVGLRILSTSEQPLQAGLQVEGHGRSLELVQLEGPMWAGLSLLPDASVSLRGSRFDVTGPAIALAARSQLHVEQSIFVGDETRPPLSPALTVGEGAALVLHRNVFTGFGPMPVAGVSADDWEPMRAGNVVVSAVTPVRR